MKDHFNIIFIVIDALRARNLGCYGFSKQLSPNIDRIAEEGVLFENAYACTNTTDSSLTTIFSGKYPLSHGIISHAGDIGTTSMRYFNDSGTKLLPEILKQKGYKTLAIDHLDRWHKRGYNYYSGKNDIPRKISKLFFRILPMGRYLTLLSGYFGHYIKSVIIDNASKTTSLAINLIKRFQKDNFFLFLHYWDLHAPYAYPHNFSSRKGMVNFLNPTFLNPLKLRKVFRYLRYPNAPHYWKPTEAIKQEYVHRYMASIEYVDNEIGKLINFLEKTNLTEKTLIILTSDHGESLLEHGIYFDHHGLYDVCIHVPLIIRYRDFPKGKQIKELVQHIDIVPTLLDMLLDTPENYNMDGKSLLPLIFGERRKHSDAIYAVEEFFQRRVAIRTNNYKYILAPTKRKAICRLCKCLHNGYEELYDIKRDPKELINLYNQNYKIKKELKEKLINWLKMFGYYKKFAKKQPETQLDAHDEMILKRLRYLGYV